MGNKKPEKKGLLDDVELALETGFSLLEMKLKGQLWTLKFGVPVQLDSAHSRYAVLLSFDPQPDEDRIASIERDLSAGLFKDDKTSQANAKRQIESIKKELEKKRDLCDDIDFAAVITEIKYTDSGTQLVAIIPDKVVSALNDQKGRLSKMYKIRLDPQAA